MVSIRPTSKRITRSFEERVKLYEAVLGFRGKGLRYTEIAREIERVFGVKLDGSQVRIWMLDVAGPYGRVHRFEAKEVPELAYVIGVKLGDATQSKNWHHNYMIKLLVTDHEFAQEFARCISVILECNIPRVWWYTKRRAWYTEVNSIMLFKFLKRPFDELRRYIDHSNECASAFLKGFFDAEGSSSGGVVTCSNTNLQLLVYVQWLLESHFGVVTNGPYEVGQRPGTKKVIKGKICNVNKQAYNLSFRRKDSTEFARLVGFTIPRKQQGICL